MPNSDRPTATIIIMNATKQLHSHPPRPRPLRRIRPQQQSHQTTGNTIQHPHFTSSISIISTATFLRGKLNLNSKCATKPRPINQPKLFQITNNPIKCNEPMQLSQTKKSTKLDARTATQLRFIRYHHHHHFVPNFIVIIIHSFYPSPSRKRILPRRTDCNRHNITQVRESAQQVQYHRRPFLFIKLTKLAEMERTFLVAKSSKQIEIVRK